MFKFLFLSILIISVHLISTDIIFADDPAQTHTSIETISEEIPIASATLEQADSGLMYVFIAFLITWIGFFFYLYYLSQKRKELANAIDSIKQKLTSKSIQS